MITEKLLVEEECQHVRSVVHNLKEFWIQRHPLLPSYTLGAASYKDAVESQPNYYKLAQRYNSILHESFQWLYERLADTLAKKLQAPVHYPENFALPGFHIFQSHQAFEQPIASIHCDLNHQLFQWESTKKIDGNDSISFTLAIALPKYGGGLNVWDLSYEEIIELSQAEINQLLKQRNQSFHSYQLGSLALHSGHILHQIAPGKNLQPDDERITLQGHGLFYQDAWLIYW